MKQIIYKILIQRNLDVKRFNLESLYQAGIENIIINIEYYYDKPYSCDSVIKELFESGVISKIKKEIQSN